MVSNDNDDSIGRKSALFSKPLCMLQAIFEDDNKQSINEPKRCTINSYSGQQHQHHGEYITCSIWKRFFFIVAISCVRELFVREAGRKRQKNLSFSNLMATFSSDSRSLHFNCGYTVHHLASVVFSVELVHRQTKKKLSTK